MRVNLGTVLLMKKTLYRPSYHTRSDWPNKTGVPELIFSHTLLTNSVEVKPLCLNCQTIQIHEAHLLYVHVYALLIHYIGKCIHMSRNFMTPSH